MTSIPHRYRLSPGPNRAALTLLTRDGAHFTVGANPAPVRSFSHGEGGKPNAPIWFTVFSPSGQAAARIDLSGDGPDAQSACHLYFKPGDPEWIWSGASVAGDAVGMLADGEGPHSQPAIVLRSPARSGASRTSPLFPCLAASRVALLDRGGTGNLLFRGNAPLSPTPGNQLVDFDTLHNTLKLAYFVQTGLTDFPGKGAYVLRAVSLLDGRSEQAMLLRESMSFKGTDPERELAGGAWFPAEPAVLSRSGVTGQMAHWPIAAADDMKPAAARLRTLMNRREALPHIYYVHCPDGRDRAGALSVWYLLNDADMPVSDAFLLGSALNGSSGRL